MTNYLEQRFKEKLYGKAYEPKKTYTIPKKSKKKIEQEKQEKERLGGDDTDLVKWYKSKIKISSGFCTWCGCPTEKNVYKYAVSTVCHLLDKRDTVCPSVKTHPMNFVILCPDHHAQFDRMNWEEREQLGFWNIIRDRLVMVYPDLAPAERRHFPLKVLEYININEPIK